MTTHQESIWAVQKTRKFLWELIDKRKPIKTSEIRKEASRLLRHYPFDSEIEKWE